MRILLAFILLGWGFSALASSPQERAAEYIEAMNLSGITSSVQYMHPELLANMRSLVEPPLREKMEENGETFPEEVTDKEFVEEILAQAPAFTVESIKIKVIGTLKEEDIRHVLIRIFTKKNELEFNLVENVPMKKHEGVWFVYDKVKFNRLSQKLASAYR